MVMRIKRTKSYVVVRGHKKGKLVFESIGLKKKEAKVLVEDIRKHKNKGSGKWAKDTKFTLKQI